MLHHYRIILDEGDDSIDEESQLGQDQDHPDHVDPNLGWEATAAFLDRSTHLNRNNRGKCTV